MAIWTGNMAARTGVAFLFSLIAGIFGRLGGQGKNGFWYQRLCNTKTRDIGIPVLFTTFMLYSYHIYNWKAFLGYFLTFGLMFSALTTYLDIIFGYDNYFAAGFLVGLSTIPCMWLGIYWYIILIKATILSIIWGCLNKYLPKLWFKDRTVAVEFLRYFFTLLILTI